MRLRQCKSVQGCTRLLQYLADFPAGCQAFVNPNLSSAVAFASYTLKFEVRSPYLLPFTSQIAFLTETPSQESVWTMSVVKVLVLSRAAYEGLLDSYPLDVRRLLYNLRRSANKVGGWMCSKDVCASERQL